MGFEKKSKPTARAYLAANQSIPNATWTKIIFDTEEWDTDGMFTPPSTDIVVKRLSGYYLIQGSVGFAANATGIRAANLPIAYNYTPALSGGITAVQIHSIYHFALNETVDIEVLQNSGAALDAIGPAAPGGRTVTWLSITHLTGR